MVVLNKHHVMKETILFIFETHMLFFNQTCEKPAALTAFLCVCKDSGDSCISGQSDYDGTVVRVESKLSHRNRNLFCMLMSEEADVNEMI